MIEERTDDYTTHQHKDKCLKHLNMVATDPTCASHREFHGIFMLPNQRAVFFTKVLNCEPGIQCDHRRIADRHDQSGRCFVKSCQSGRRDSSDELFDVWFVQNPHYRVDIILIRVPAGVDMIRRPTQWIIQGLGAIGLFLKTAAKEEAQAKRGARVKVRSMARLI